MAESGTLITAEKQVEKRSEKLLYMAGETVLARYL